MRYEGEISASCTLGEVILSNACYEAPCNDTSRMITLTDGNTMAVQITASALGLSDARTPSPFSNPDLSCAAFNSSIDGIARVHFERVRMQSARLFWQLRGNAGQQGSATYARAIAV
ncbi:unnamed protein product [Effrenium voratum]|nr:unnamed protein product [Effrenium voratum]